MTFENCLESRNETLTRLFDSQPILHLPGNAVGADGRQLSEVLRDLPVCDLQEELDNVLLRFDNKLDCV